MTRRADWIAYASPVSFPWGQPGSRRIYGIAGSLAAAGYRTVVLSGDDGPSSPVRLEEVDGPGQVLHVGLGEGRPAPGPAGLAAARHFLRRGQRTVQWLEAQPTKPSHVLVYGGGAQYMVQLRRWCRRNRVPLIADVVEWSNPWHLRGGVLAPGHLSATVALRHHYPRCDGLIAISSLLEEHFRSWGSRVLRVPPTLDVQNLPRYERRAGPNRPDLSLVYAGTPGRKDLLAHIIRAVGRVGRGGASIELRVYGPTPEQVRELLDGEPLPPGVRLLGRLAQQDVPRALQEADFSVLLRRPQRFAHAGFPTKFCESLANGTPVIANVTSDLASYLRDGVEGLVCRGYSVDDLERVLRNAVGLGDDERRRMRRAARQRALESFDFRRYAEPLGAFVESVRR
jgi:glycosyltransferase involved in cell wall biosynthesis